MLGQLAGVADQETRGDAARGRLELARAAVDVADRATQAETRLRSGLERARKEFGALEKAVKKDIGSLRESARAFQRCLRDEGVDRGSLLGALLRGLPAGDVERLSDAYAACRSKLPLLPALGG